MNFKALIAGFLLLSILACVSELKAQTSETLIYPEEKHFKNMRQLTFGGDNAEAYFGFDNKHITFQRTEAKDGVPCDQIFYGPIPKKGKLDYKLVSTGKGRTTCAYLMPDMKHLLYASTHLSADTCPAVPDRTKIKKYVWPIYESYDIFVADFDGNITQQLTKSPGYDAEATISPDGKTIVFTSRRNGDIDLYLMNIDGTNVRQITNTVGYDGGANFSPDGKMITWRASRPQNDEQLKEYKDLLAQGLVMPTSMELFVANADGSNAKQITKFGRANWAPAFMPNSKKIIFASNHEHERGYPFNLYTINIDGSGLERISKDSGFDAFPMFSPDGKRLIFSSNRNNKGTRDTNIFICDWVD